MDEKRKICPMKLTVKISPVDTGVGGSSGRYCEVHDCGWWSREWNCCALLGIAEVLCGIEEQLRWRK